MRQELSAESLKITVLCEDLNRANAELRKLRLEKIGLEQELANLKNDAQLNAVQKEIEDDNAPLTKNDDELPIRQYSQNVDFSRLEKKMRNSVKMTDVIKSIFDEEDKENEETNNEDIAVVEKHENNSVVVREEIEKPRGKVTFLEETPVTTNKAPVRKCGKIIKCNPIIFSSYKNK